MVKLWVMIVNVRISVLLIAVTLMNNFGRLPRRGIVPRNENNRHHIRRDYEASCNLPKASKAKCLATTSR